MCVMAMANGAITISAAVKINVPSPSLNLAIRDLLKAFLPLIFSGDSGRLVMTILSSSK